MFSFFIKKILGKYLAIPLVWSFAYPNLVGDLVIENIRLQPRSANISQANYQANLQLGFQSLITVKRAEINLRWASVFSPVVQVDRATLTEANGRIDLRDPLLIIRCLQRRDCLESNVNPNMPNPDRSGQRARMETKTPFRPSKAEPVPRVREKLRVRAQKLELLGGRIELSRDKPLAELLLVQLTGTDVSLPLEQSDLKLKVDAYVRSVNSSKKHPIRVYLSWSDSKQELLLELLVDQFPVEIVDAVFGDVLSANPLSSTAGDISGKILLGYSPNGGWALRDLS